MSNLTGNYGKVPSHEIACNPPIRVIDSGCLALPGRDLETKGFRVTLAEEFSGELFEVVKE